MNPRTWAKLYYTKATVQINRVKDRELAAVIDGSAPRCRGELCRSLMRDGLRFRDGIADNKELSPLWASLTNDQKHALVAVGRGFAAYNDAAEKLAVNQ